MAEAVKKTIDPVAIPCKAYYHMEKERRMIRDLLGGTRTMRLAREEYLPKFQGEDDKAYEDRVKQSFLYNHYKKAVQALVGKPFSRPISHPETEPEELKPIVNDFDMQGNDITMYAKKWFECGMSFGLSFTLIDFPDTGGAYKTKADEKKENLRPYAVHIPAGDVIGWRAVDVNGVYKLQQIRIKQCIEEPDGEYGEVEKEVIRVFEWEPSTNTVSWKVYEDKGESGWVQTKFGVLQGIDEIPVVPFYTGQTGFLTAEPPLLDLAYLNVAHWQSTSDHRHIMHIQAVPILFAKGWGKSETPSTAQVGPNRMMVTASPDASLQYVEHTGAAIGKLENYIDKLEDQMAAMAIKLLAEKRPGGVTASEVIIDADAAESALKSMVAALQDALSHVIYFMELWLGKRLEDDQIPEYKINNDFGLMIGNDMIANWLLKAQSMGIIQKTTVIDGAKKVGYLAPELDADEEIEAASEESRIAMEAVAAAMGDDDNPPPGNKDDKPMKKPMEGNMDDGQ